MFPCFAGLYEYFQCIYHVSSLAPIAFTMSSIIDSAAHFDTRCRTVGLSAGALTDLKRHGVTTLASLAFSVGQPGQPIDNTAVDAFLRQAIVNIAITVHDTNVVRRLIFEAHTLVIASLRQTVEQKDDSAPRKVPQAERNERMDQVKRSLAGISVTGEYDPSHALLDRATHMLEHNTIKYIEPAACLSRSAEVLGESKDKRLSLEGGSLVVRERDNELRTQTQTEMQLFYAFARRGIALQFADIMRYEVHSQWTTFLFESMNREAPPGYGSPGINAVIQCDRAAWVRLAEACPNIKRDALGNHPIEAMLLALRSDPTIVLHLAPLSKGGSGKRAVEDGDDHNPKTPRPNPKFKGKGKGRGKPTPSMPAELRGKWHSTPNGEPLCYGFNTAKGCPEKNIKPGERCKKGWHNCAEPRCQQPHPVFQHRK